MPAQAALKARGESKPAALYAKLEERIIARDQVGASEVYYELLKRGRPQTEILAEAVRIHAPYTHVPYHERIDEGFVNFVNNDHCLLSARAALHLAKLMPDEAAGLPVAQTIWYIPTGLDIWNQKIYKAPGHYSRRGEKHTGPAPMPVVYWPDAEPQQLEGSLQERLGQWMTLVHRGQVMDAYRAFLGLMQNPAERRAALAELCFAGLIDVQDRSFLNRSYTTGHKAFRARATVELGDALGWENAHDVLYAGALDIAVGPRWYSTYEMAGNVITARIEQQPIMAIPYKGTTERERALLANAEPLTAEEGEAFLDVVLNQPEPAYIDRLTELLLAGKRLRDIVDAIQLGAARVVLETTINTNFSLSQHCYEYCNTLGWFFDTFDHPQRVKLLYVVTSYLNQAARHQRNMGDLKAPEFAAVAGADRLSSAQLLDRIEAAVIALDGPQGLGLTRAYCASGADRAPLVKRLALAATRLGNDPHNQEIAQCLLEDYGKNRGWDRDRLLYACVQHTAVHRKYGDPLDCARRFGVAMGVASLQ
ncbi:MAG TPA: hypothetical protein VMB81_30095 [Candidatus Sulfotelmatobacter sp.]|nr:hypothetical protein [Candidatus Sulfotelmatobacter sp.]